MKILLDYAIDSAGSVKAFIKIDMLEKVAKWLVRKTKFIVPFSNNNIHI